MITQNEYYMKTLTQLILLFAILPIFLACSDDSNHVENDKIVGAWTNVQVTNTTNPIWTYTKTDKIPENTYGMTFYANNKFVERRIVGTCGTPPVVYGDYEGTWSIEKDTLLSISVKSDFGVSHTQWKIMSVDNSKLVLSFIKQFPDSVVIAYKPNIYIYPKEKINLSVNVSFPKGGKILTSIPEYGTGWNVAVDKTGLIDNQYSYLFYESVQPDVWQTTLGWSISKEELASFFRKNMLSYGFNEKEIGDFVEYWVPRLQKYPYYDIYPQTGDLINTVIDLDFSKTPENILRLFYVIRGDNKKNLLMEPTVKSFAREGYFVTEWGVILK